MSTVSREDLISLEEHWSVAAIPSSERERALELARVRRLRLAIGEQMLIAFDENVGDDPLLERVALAYEFAAIDGLAEMLMPSADPSHKEQEARARAGAFRAYELRAELAVPTDDRTRVLHVLHLGALAYCGDRWSDVRRWLADHVDAVKALPESRRWDDRLLGRIFDCWIRLLRKESWQDLDGVATIISELRTEQASYEQEFLNPKKDPHVESTAYRLVCLYHWARATERLALYMLQGEPAAIDTELDKHCEAAREAARLAGDAALDVLMRWLHVAGRRMAAGSVWWVARAVNSRVTKFVQSITRASKPLFELLPPQRAALREQGLLDQASRAVVIDLPTSGGKTTLAEFRILQALNQFDADKGWVAYVAPTRALVSQITRRLRRDFGPFKVEVEQLTAAVETDSFEDILLTTDDDRPSFHVLVATPEKLNFVIRNKKVKRPLALIVMDEAHNIEDEDRGLRIELLLATVKRDCPTARFLLLMPHVPNARELTQWLAPEGGKTISLGTTAWQPNERAVGIFSTVPAEGRGNWSLNYTTLVTSPGTLHIKGSHRVGGIRPLPVPSSEAKAVASLQAAAMATVFAKRGTSIAVGPKVATVWKMAERAAAKLGPWSKRSTEASLVQRFLKAEISPEYQLINLLDAGVAVHHSELSEETRSLVEWLTEIGQIRVLCATTSIAQGLNFPVSSVFLASRHLFSDKCTKEMTKRAFWNLAGRAGRMDQSSVGIVGIAEGSDREATVKYVAAQTEYLVSRLVRLLEEVEKRGQLENLRLVIQGDQWTDFRSYVAHLYAERQSLDAVLSETEQLLRNTFGFDSLRRGQNPKNEQKTKALLAATREYAQTLSNNQGAAMLADATGFAPEGVARAIAQLGSLDRKLTQADWMPQSLFGPKGVSVLPQLMGVMMSIPQLHSLNEIAGAGLDRKRLAELAQAWVSGRSIEQIATGFFSTDTNATTTDRVGETCKAIYRTLANIGTWGLAALTRLPTSGLDFEKLPEDVRRSINNLPAMLYHGVQSEAAILMRMNAVPRSVAESLGQRFNREVKGGTEMMRPSHARDFLRSLTERDWSAVSPNGSPMSGSDYREVWKRLSGES